MVKFRAILARRWPILLVATLLGIPAGVLSSNFGADSAKPVWVAQQVVVSNRGSGNNTVVQQDVLKVTRGDVTRQAAATLGVTDVAGLISKITSNYDDTSESIRISSADRDSKVAAKRVDAFVQAFLKIVNAQLSVDEQRQLDALKKRSDDAAADLKAFDQVNPDISNPTLNLPQTDAVQQAFAERRRLEDLANSALQAYQNAQLQTSSRAPYSTLGPELPTLQTSYIPKVPRSPIFRAGLLGLLGLMLGVVIVMIIERLNQRIDTRDELAEVLDIPILAEIGHIPKRRMSVNEDGTLRLDGVWAESYRRIRSAIQFVNAEGTQRLTGADHGALNGAGANGAGTNGTNGATANGTGEYHDPLTSGPPRTFLFTSTLPGEGKSTCVALTAMALAEAGVDTLVVNADFRKPQVDKLLGANPTPSLEERAQLTLDRPSVDEVVQPGRQPHLWVAASGRPTFEVGPRLAAAREVAVEAAARGATVLIDSTPVRVANDPVDLLPVIDGLILVIRSGRSTRRSLADTVELLELHGAPLLGAVLIGTQGSRELYAYYDSYYSRVQPLSSQNGASGEVHVNGAEAPAQYADPYATEAHSVGQS